MLEHYFRRPVTVDRIRALWLGPQIDHYVGWLQARRASSGIVLQHVRTLRHFNQFVCARGVTSREQLPSYVQPFIDEWMLARAPSRLSKAARGTVLSNAQVPVEQLLELTVPGFARVRHRVAIPFMASVPGFFPFLREERGLRPGTCAGHAVELLKFEAFLQRSDVGLSDLSPSLLGRYVADGHTLLLHHIGMATAPALFRRLGYDPQKDFEPIGVVVDAPMVLLAHPSVPAASAKQLIEYVKRNEATVTIGYAGPGAASHLCGLLLASVLRVDLISVPYTGTGPALAALVRISEERDRPFRERDRRIRERDR
jgi:hypothetical protein